MSNQSSPRRDPHTPRRRQQQQHGDVEAQGYAYSTPASHHSSPRRHHHSRRRSSRSNREPASSPGYFDEQHHLMSANQNELGRKKSLVRHERRPPDPQSRDYHYRQHAARMNVQPSTTGVDPHLDDDDDLSSTSMEAR